MAPEQPTAEQTGRIAILGHVIPNPCVTLNPILQATTDAQRKALVKAFIANAMHAFEELSRKRRDLHGGAPDLSAEEYSQLDEQMEALARLVIPQAEDLAEAAETLGMSSDDCAALRDHALNWRFILDWDIPSGAAVPERAPVDATSSEIDTIAAFRASLAAGAAETISDDEMARRIESD